jgi:hypothetical protein
LAVSEEGACSRVTVNFDKMRAARRGGTFDGVQFTGMHTWYSFVCSFHVLFSLIPSWMFVHFFLTKLTGSMDQAIKDAVLVGLSFMRAHAPWLKEHYGLKIDPRKRRKHDWVFVLNSFGVPITGASIGAAIAGDTPCMYPLGLIHKRRYLVLLVGFKSEYVMAVIV